MTDFEIKLVREIIKEKIPDIEESVLNSTCPACIGANSIMNSHKCSDAWSLYQKDGLRTIAEYMMWRYKQRDYQDYI